MIVIKESIFQRFVSFRPKAAKLPEYDQSVIFLTGILFLPIYIFAKHNVMKKRLLKAILLLVCMTLSAQ